MNRLVTVDPIAPSRGVAGRTSRPTCLSVRVAKSIVGNAWWNPEETRRGLMYAPAG